MGGWVGGWTFSNLKGVDEARWGGAGSVVCQTDWECTLDPSSPCHPWG